MVDAEEKNTGLLAFLRFCVFAFYGMIFAPISVQTFTNDGALFLNRDAFPEPFWPVFAG